MSRRFMEWRNGVFLQRQELLVVSGFEGALTDRPSATMSLEASRALRKLSQLPGVHVAILSKRPLSDLAWRCLDVPRAWLVADDGETVRDPNGTQLLLRRRTRTVEAPPHGIREVVDRLRPGTAILLGVDERLDCAAVAAAHVRPTGLALHVAGTGSLPRAELAEGIVQGCTGWIELLERLHGAIILRDAPAPAPARRSGPPARVHDHAPR